MEPRARDTHGLLTVEQHAAFVGDLLPGATREQTRDVVQFTESGESETGIVVLVTAEALELRLPTVEWTCGAYGPVETSRLWKRVKWSSLKNSQLSELIEVARQARKREFLLCKFCGKRVPPGHRHSRNVCHGCAARHLGVVY